MGLIASPILYKIVTVQASACVYVQYRKLLQYKLQYVCTQYRKRIIVIIIIFDCLAYAWIRKDRFVFHTCRIIHMIPHLHKMFVNTITGSSNHATVICWVEGGGILLACCRPGITIRVRSTNWSGNQAASGNTRRIGQQDTLLEKKWSVVGIPSYYTKYFVINTMSSWLSDPNKNRATKVANWKIAQSREQEIYEKSAMFCLFQEK